MTLLWDAPAAVKAVLDAAVAVPVYEAGELVGDDERAYVTVGEVGEDGEIASATQEATALGGNQWHLETGSIPCALEAWDGGADIASVRVTAKALLTACVQAVRNDRSLGGLLVLPGLAEVTDLRLSEGQTSRGVLVRAGFTVRYTALLTS